MMIEESDFDIFAYLGGDEQKLWGAVLVKEFKTKHEAKKFIKALVLSTLSV